MRQKSGQQETAEKHVKDIRRKTRRKYFAEEKIRIVRKAFVENVPLRNCAILVRFSKNECQSAAFHLPNFAVSRATTAALLRRRPSTKLSGGAISAPSTRFGARRSRRKHGVPTLGGEPQALSCSCPPTVRLGKRRCSRCARTISPVGAGKRRE